MLTLVNADLVTQPAGSLVRAGAVAGTCEMALADTLAHVDRIFGVRIEDVLTTASGPISVLQSATVVRLTEAAAVGDQLYVSAAVAGSATKNPPTIAIKVGIVLFAYNSGGVEYANIVPSEASTTSSAIPDPTAKGDLITHDGASSVILPVGTVNGQILVVNSLAPTGIAWQTPSPGGAFTTAYEVDFSTLGGPTNLATGGDGTKTIDGKTWNLLNSASASSVYLNDGTHSGLYIRCSTANTLNSGANLTGPQMYAKFTDLAPALLLANWSEARIWFKFTQPHTPNADFEYAHLGFVEWNALVAYGATSINRFNIVNGYATGAVFEGKGYFTYAGAATTNRGGLAAPVTYQDIAMIWVKDGVVELYFGVDSGGALPPATDMVFAARGSRVGTAVMQTPDTPMVWFSATPNNTAGNSDLLVERLKIEYR